MDAKDFQRMWRERETSGGRTRKGSSDAGMRRGTIEMFDEGTGRRRGSDGSNGEGGSVPGNTFEVRSHLYGSAVRDAYRIRP